MMEFKIEFHHSLVFCLSELLLSAFFLYVLSDESNIMELCHT